MNRYVGTTQGVKRAQNIITCMKKICSVTHSIDFVPGQSGLSWHGLKKGPCSLGTKRTMTVTE